MGAYTAARKDSSVNGRYIVIGPVGGVAASVPGIVAVALTYSTSLAYKGYYGAMPVLTYIKHAVLPGAALYRIHLCPINLLIV